MCIYGFLWLLLEDELLCVCVCVVYTDLRGIEMYLHWNEKLKLDRMNEILDRRYP